MIATPTAPPPDIVPDYTEESESQDPVDAVNDTNQLVWCSSCGLMQGALIHF